MPRYRRLVALNTTAVVRLASAVAPRFAEAREGAIINISSVVGLAPEFGMSVYGAAKAFVTFLSQGLSLELGSKGVYVQAVLPAATRTEIWERSGTDVNSLPAVMEVEELVDAALVGFDRREPVTIPPLHDAGQWDAYQSGDILGHEFMGIVEEVGKDVTNLRRGDRVVVPFTIACGNCLFCKKKIWAACDNSNPNAHLMEAAYGYSGSGLFGYSHMMGGYAGGQAQYARVPFANVGPLKIESDLPDEKVLFLSDIFPTGYMAAENAQIQPGDTVAVWGCGPVGQFAIASAFMLGAARVIAIDRLPERLEMARSLGAITVNYSEEDVSVLTALKDLTGGIGPDGCIDAVGLEAHSAQLQGTYDKIKVALLMETDRPSVLRQAIQAVRKGGTLSVPGVYGGLLDKIPFGAAFGKGITMKMGQTNMHNYMQPLLERIEKGQIDPSYIISHRITLEQAPEMYKVWRDKKENVTKIVIDPWADVAA